MSTSNNYSSGTGNTGNYGRRVLTGLLLTGAAVAAAGCARALEGRLSNVETTPHYWASRTFTGKDYSREVGMAVQAVTSRYSDEKAQRDARKWANFVRVTPTNLRDEVLVELFWDDGDGKLTEKDRNLGEKDPNGRPKVYLLKATEVESFVTKMLEGKQ